MFKTNELRDVRCKTWSDFAHHLFISQFLREFKMCESEINPYSVLSLFACSNRIEAAYFKNNAERLVNGENRRWKQKAIPFIFPIQLKGCEMSWASIPVNRLEEMEKRITPRAGQRWDLGNVPAKGSRTKYPDLRLHFKHGHQIRENTSAGTEGFYAPFIFLFVRI